MRTPKAATFLFLAVWLGIVAPPVHAQEAAQSEREAMYYRYLEFPSLVKGGSIEPHWMADGSSFWYAEGAPGNGSHGNALDQPPLQIREQACTNPEIGDRRMKSDLSPLSQVFVTSNAP